MRGALAPGPRPSADGPVDVTRLTRDERLVLLARTRVLRILDERGQVTPDVHARALHAPVGGWHALDR